MLLLVNHIVIKKTLPLSVMGPYSILGRSFSTDKKNDESLIPNAPGWNEKNATESEADVKADHNPDNFDAIKKKTTEKFKEQSDK